jgi:SET domain-containing protein
MDKWVLFTKKGRSINHSCDPNCGIGFDGVNWSYKAFKDIKEGD